MLVLNQKLSAQQALQFKFVSEVYAADEKLETKIMPRIQEYAKLPQASIRISKQLIRRFEENLLLAACDHELAELKELLATDESKNAMMKIRNSKANEKL